MKKILSLLLCIAMVCGLAVTTNAANELSNAKNYKIGSKQSGSIVEGDKTDVWSFTLATAGKIDIKLSADMYYMYIQLYDSNGKEIYVNHQYWNDTTEEIAFSDSIYLCKGDYYISFNSEKYGNYDFSVDFTATYESFEEKQNGSNNKTKEASAINHGNNYVGCLALNDDADVYKFELNNSGKLNINLSANMYYMYIKLYDSNGKEIYVNHQYWNDTTEEITFVEDIYLCKGTYYISISSSRQGEYNFTLLYTDSNESFAETQGGINNKINSASNISINQQYSGLIALNDDVDIYRVNITSSNTKINLSANMYYMYIKLYDSNGKEIYVKQPYWNNTTEEIAFNDTIKVSPGLYYLSFSSSKNGVYEFYLSDGGVVSKMPTSNSVITVKINGSPVIFDQPPLLENGRTLVPLRAIFEALGANVDWNDETQTVIATKGATKVSLTIGSNRMYVNGSEKTLDVPAKLINSRTLVPVRAISEAFGCKVNWDENTQTVIINN